MRIVALIPAYNEADTIIQTLRAVENIDAVDEMVVIDDGSKDNTLSQVQKYKENSKRKVTVYSLKENKGKGAALNYGLANTFADIYLLLDADLGHTASLADALLQPVLSNKAHMTIASFTENQSLTSSKMGFGFARRTATFGIQLLTGVNISSPLSGQRAIKADVLKTLGEFSPGFGVEVCLTTGAVHHGFKILEVPVAMKHRAHGRGLRGFKHRGRQWIHVLRGLWSCWKRGWHR